MQQYNDGEYFAEAFVVNSEPLTLTSGLSIMIWASADFRLAATPVQFANEVEPRWSIVDRKTKTAFSPEVFSFGDLEHAMRFIWALQPIAERFLYLVETCAPASFRPDHKPQVAAELAQYNVLVAGVALLCKALDNTFEIDAVVQTEIMVKQ